MIMWYRGLGYKEYAIRKILLNGNNKDRCEACQPWQTWAKCLQANGGLERSIVWQLQCCKRSRTVDKSLAKRITYNSYKCSSWCIVVDIVEYIGWHQLWCWQRRTTKVELMFSSSACRLSKYPVLHTSPWCALPRILPSLDMINRPIQNFRPIITLGSKGTKSCFIGRWRWHSFVYSLVTCESVDKLRCEYVRRLKFVHQQQQHQHRRKWHIIFRSVVLTNFVRPDEARPKSIALTSLQYQV